MSTASAASVPTSNASAAPAVGQPAATGEPAPASPPAAPAPTASRQFPAIAAKEKALQRKREEISRQAAQVSAREAAIAAREQEIEGLRAKPKTPLEALERFGFSYKDATEYALNDGQPSPEMLARAANERIDRLEQERKEELKRAGLEATTVAEKQSEEILTNFKQEIGAFGEQNKDKYEAVAVFGASSLVYDTIEEYFEKSKRDDAAARGIPIEQGTGRVLSISEAYDLVEAHLREHAKGISGAKFLKASEPTTEPQGQTAGKSEPVIAQRRTVNNGLTPSTPTQVPPKIEADRMSRALRALGE